VLPVALILVLLGGLIISPFLAFAATGLKTGDVYESKLAELYAADAGVEDAVWKATHGYAELEELGAGESYSYSLPASVNSLLVDMTVTKISLLQGVVDDDEYKLDRPHEDWVTFDAPVVAERTDEYVEYSCSISFHYAGLGKRTIQILGVFFATFPGDRDLITDPYDVAAVPVITFAELESDSPQIAVAPGGFAFTWRWQENSGPVFDKNNPDGSLSFKFKVYNPGWETDFYFCFATLKEEDVSYITTIPGGHKWLIEAAAGDTLVTSLIVEGSGVLNILTWEVRQ